MAIQAAPEPKNVTELQSFLGMINYYGRFLPMLALTKAGSTESTFAPERTLAVER